MELTALDVASEKGSAFSPFRQRRAVDVIAGRADVGAAVAASPFVRNRRCRKEEREMQSTRKD